MCAHRRRSTTCFPSPRLALHHGEEDGAKSRVEAGRVGASPRLETAAHSRAHVVDRCWWWVSQNRAVIYDPRVSTESVQRLSLSDTEVWPEELIACRGTLPRGPSARRLHAISVLRGAISRAHTLRRGSHVRTVSAAERAVGLAKPRFAGIHASTVVVRTSRHGDR